MKKILTALAITSLTVTPAIARDYHRDRDDRHEHHERHHSGGKWVAPLLGGLILGVILSKNSNDNREVQPERVYPVEPVYQYVPTCWYEDRPDYYGYIRTYKVCR